MSLYTFLANRIVYPMGDILMGTHIVKSLKELERLQWDNPEKIRDRQDELLRKLIAHSYENVPYWRDVFDKAGIKPEDIKGRAELCKLPILSKDNIRKNIDSMTATNVNASKLRENHSSGSTGEPLKYFDDKEHYSWRIASMLRFWKWAGFEFGQKWMRVSSWKRNSFKDKAWDFFSRCAYINLFGFNRDSLERSRRILTEWKPEVVRGYAGALYIIADYLSRIEVSLDYVKSVITTGDILFQHYREKIERVFGAKVFDTYGGEGMSIAGQCEYGSYHIDDLNVIVEVVDVKEQPANPGSFGRIIVTDLNNYAMPFIRYDIGDMGILRKGQCKCGRGLSLMEQPQGRDTDIIYLSNGSYLIVHFFTTLFEFYNEVKQFQVIETKQDEIQLNLVVNNNFNNRVLEEIKQKIIEGAGCQIAIRENIIDEIPLTPSGKRRFVISDVEK